MLITVWRHGEAAPGSPDRERQLTERGHADLARAVPAYAAMLAQRGLAAPTAMHFSRWVRTRQTAEYLQQHWPALPAEPMEALIPDRTVAGVEQALSALAATAHSHWVLVSHQPLVSELIEHWLGEPHPTASLAPGAFAVLSLPVLAAGCGSLTLSASPPEYRVG